MKKIVYWGKRFAAIMFTLLVVVYSSRYVYAHYLLQKIAGGQEINTLIGNLTSAPVWCDDLSAITQGHGVRILLVEACYYRNTQAVSELLKNGADPNFYITGRKTPLEAALWNGSAGPIDDKSLEIVELLISAGADIDLHASEESVVSALAASMLPNDEFREKIFFLLLDHGAVKEPQESENILHSIIRSGNVEVAYQLITNYGFNVNSIGNLGQTPLILAVYYGQYNGGVSSTIDMVRMLIDCNADTHAKDEYGKSAFDYAVEYGYDDIVELLK
jgi:ankyrin repeat protein